MTSASVQLHTSKPSSHRNLSARVPIYVWLILATAFGVAVAELPIAWIASITAATISAFAIIAHPLAALGLLLVIAPLRTLYATEAPRLGFPALPLDIGQWLVLAFVVSWLIHLIRHRRLPYGFEREKPRRALYVLAPLAVFIFAAGLSGFAALSMAAWVTEWLKWLQMALIAVIIIDLCAAGHRRAVVALLILAGATNALIGGYQYFGGSGALHLLINERNFRAFGTFGQPNPFGGFMGITFPLAFVSFLAATCTAIRALIRRAAPTTLIRLLIAVLYGTAASLIAAGLVMSWSRGAWLGFALSIAVMQFALPRRLSHSLLLAAVVTVVIGVVAASGRVPASITSRIATIAEDIFDVQDVRGVDITPVNYAVIERLAHWQAAVNMATAQPWLGVGLGNYEVAYADFRLANWKFALGHAHNIYLNMLAEVGVVGLVAYVTFIIATMWYSWRVRQHPEFEARATAVGILGVWTYLIVHSLTDNLFVNNVFIHLSVTIGILASLVREIPKLTIR